MKIVLIGDFSKNRDEGLKNIAHNLSQELSNYGKVLEINIANLDYINDINKIKKYSPNIIHYIPGPTTYSLIFSSILGRYCKSKVVLSAPQPRFSLIFNKSIFYFKPDIILTQSTCSSESLSLLGIENRLVPNGVDTLKYIPINYNKKLILRSKYNLNPHEFTILHVGHLTKRRNLDILGKMSENGFQVIIVASEYLTVDNEIYEKLSQKGCKILLGYQANLEEIYGLSDCYVFPVKRDNTILTPLSVLEAMSCNLPIITTKFDGLTTNFQEGNGLIYIDDDLQIEDELNALNPAQFEIRTREKVLSLSWDNIAKKIFRIYEELMDD